MSVSLQICWKLHKVGNMLGINNDMQKDFECSCVCVPADLLEVAKVLPLPKPLDDDFAHAKGFAVLMCVCPCRSAGNGRRW